MAKQRLNLLVIDADQLYAERLVKLLGHYYHDVHLGFLDDKAEFLRCLRNDWDALLFNRAYDMDFNDVMAILQQEEVGIPAICLSNDKTPELLNDDGLPQAIDGNVIKTISPESDLTVVMAICLQADYIRNKRQIESLRHILSEAEQRANTLIANSKSAVAYIDQGVHVYANEPYLQMFGYQSLEDIIGVPVIDLIAGNDDIKNFKQFLRKFDKGDRSQVEFKFVSKHTDGTSIDSKLQLASATYDGEPVIQIIIQADGGDAAELAKQLEAVERQDKLTGLANRQGFEEQFHAVHADAVAGKHTAALLYCYLDGVGNIYSSLGIAGLDAVVKRIAYTLDEFFGEGSVSRFSDTAFAILLTDKSKSEVEAMAESIRAKIADMMIEIGQRTVTASLSIGMVMMDANTADAATVLNRAIELIAQIGNETDGQGNKVKMFDISEHASDDENALAEYLANALAQNQFKLLYQSVYDIETNESDLFEVYLRLPMADGSELAPDKFLHIAKSHNLLEKIDRWVLINASKYLSQVRAQHPSAKLLVTLSSATLTSQNLANIVKQLTRAIGGESDSLILQFEEQDLVDYLAVAKRQFMALEKLGCKVSVKNFGATAKSVDTIEYLNPQMVRLARSYIKGLDRAENLQTVQSLVAKVKERSATTLMPGIEDAAMMSAAWSVGARYLQGRYLQEPTDAMVFGDNEE